MQKFKCGKCGTIFIADTRRWHMDYCPKGCTAVDLEERYCLYIGAKGKVAAYPVLIEEFKPPWFEEEDNYHSALLGWLNDSDEKHMLKKDNGTLLIIRKSRRKVG